MRTLSRVGVTGSIEKKREGHLICLGDLKREGTTDL
jgi:hypothetical protein